MFQYVLCNLITLPGVPSGFRRFMKTDSLDLTRVYWQDPFNAITLDKIVGQKLGDDEFGRLI
jgi:hypothetical protein